MPRIIPIVEGEGEVEAVPLLLRRILEYNGQWNWSVGRPTRAGHLDVLRHRLSRVLQRAQQEPDCAGILILLDLDDGCPYEEARNLAAQVRQLNLPIPVAIVFAHREYEAWFLASLATIAGSYGLPPDLTYPGDVEARRGVKECLTRQMPSHMPYKETVHQAKFTARIDLALARDNSRSFRRLLHAVEQLVQAAGTPQPGFVTPNP